MRPANPVPVNEHMELSRAGAAFIAGWEGDVLTPYNDADNPPNATIGIGHLIHEGPVTRADIRRWRGFSYEDSLQLLQADVRQVEEQIRAKITHPLAQNEWDALVDVLFNTGPGILDAGVAEAINAGRMQQATEVWAQWIHGNGGVVLEGLVHRRAGDTELFLRTPAPYENPQEARWEHEYDQLAHRTGWAANARRRALVRAMTRRRKEIWHLANTQPGGWGKLNRASRYRQLLARTEG
jgi:GH24 family phage-related lysozyme (muramidase)